MKNTGLIKGGRTLTTFRHGYIYRIFLLILMFLVHIYSTRNGTQFLGEKLKTAQGALLVPLEVVGKHCFRGKILLSLKLTRREPFHIVLLLINFPWNTNNNAQLRLGLDQFRGQSFIYCNLSEAMNSTWLTCK